MVSHFNDNLLYLESSVQLKEEKTTLDMEDKGSVPEDTSTSQVRSRNKLPYSAKQKVIHSTSGVEGTSSKKSKLGRDSTVDMNIASTMAQQPRSDTKTWKRKRKFLGQKVTFDIGFIFICLTSLYHELIFNLLLSDSCSSYRCQVQKLIWSLIQAKL